MATIDGRPAQYGVTLKQLRELMEHRGREGIAKLNELGGVQDLCKKLFTSPSEGIVFEYIIEVHMFYINIILLYVSCRIKWIFSRFGAQKRNIQFKYHTS